MKLSPGRQSKRRSQWWGRGAALLCAVLLLAGPLACGRKASSAHPGGPTSAQKRDQSFATPLKQQVRWSYEVETSPPLNKKPAYLLKTIGFAQSSTTVDVEAIAVIRDVAAVMKERPKIRVLFLGLTDRGAEKLNADDLGQKRARSARESLIGLGITKDRTEAATLGSKVAQGDPNDAVSQEKDRRVEIWLIEE